MSETEVSKRLTPIKAIRKACLQCCCGQTAEIRYCTIPSCGLYPYRLGRRPRKDDYHYREEDADLSHKEAEANHQKRLANGWVSPLVATGPQIRPDFPENGSKEGVQERGSGKKCVGAAADPGGQKAP